MNRMNNEPERAARAAFIHTRLLAAVALLVLLGSTGYGLLRGEQRTRECMRQLRHIYMALELYELDHGALPHLAFYPHDPRHATDSMLVVLDPYAITGDIGLCPASHDVVRHHGLSYVWNANLNGKSLHGQPPGTWLVKELNGLSDQVSRPHLGHYLTLYVDGRIERTRKPPPDLLAIDP